MRPIYSFIILIIFLCFISLRMGHTQRKSQSSPSYSLSQFQQDFVN